MTRILAVLVASGLEKQPWVAERMTKKLTKNFSQLIVYVGSSNR